MKVEVKDVSPVEKMVEIEVEAELVTDEIEEQYGELQRTAQVKGFRPGKVPRKILERLFKSYVYERVVKKLIEETLQPALDRKQVKPAVEPVIDPAEVKPGEAYAYTAHVEVLPVVAAVEYKGLTVSHQDDRVGEEQVAEAIQSMRENAATIREPEPARPVRAGDQVTAEVVIKEGEEELYRQPDEVIELWRPSWIPGLSERLEGHVAGDRVEFTAAAAGDEGVPERFRGKTLAFAMAVKGIKERLIPELDEAFVKEYTRHQTIEEFTANVRERLTEAINSQNRGRLESSVLKALVDRNPVEVPPTLVKREALTMAKEFLRRSLKKAATDEDAERFLEMFLGEAKFAFQANYLMEEVAKAEKVEVSDEEVAARIEEEAERARMHPEKFRARLDEQELAALKHRVSLDKTLDFLLREATIKEQAPIEA
jgi:trigger factor